MTYISTILKCLFYNHMQLNSFLFTVLIGESAVSKPVTIDPMSNQTVVIGSDVTLQCVVKNLQNYKVIWLHCKCETVTILFFSRESVPPVP